MIKKCKNNTKESIKDFVDSYTLVLWGLSVLASGYIIGRITAVSDLQKGKLNMFIPKDH